MPVVEEYIRKWVEGAPDSWLEEHKGASDDIMHILNTRWQGNENTSKDIIAELNKKYGKPSVDKAIAECQGKVSAIGSSHDGSRLQMMRQGGPGGQPPETRGSGPSIGQLIAIEQCILTKEKVEGGRRRRKTRARKTKRRARKTRRSRK